MAKQSGTRPFLLSGAGLVCATGRSLAQLRWGKPGRSAERLARIDRAAAEARSCEALPLQPEERHALVGGFESACAGCRGECDAAVAHWNAKRPAR